MLLLLLLRARGEEERVRYSRKLVYRCAAT